MTDTSACPCPLPLSAQPSPRRSTNSYRTPTYCFATKRWVTRSFNLNRLTLIYCLLILFEWYWLMILYGFIDSINWVMVLLQHAYQIHSISCSLPPSPTYRPHSCYYCIVYYTWYTIHYKDNHYLIEHINAVNIHLRCITPPVRVDLPLPGLNLICLKVFQWDFNRRSFGWRLTTS